VQEIIYYGHDRKSWLIFCTGIDHAYHIRDALRERGVAVETVTGETNTLERDYILGEFKAERLKAVTNCDILTTGFNHPGVDLIAFLRPTKSTGLYVQMAGRGMRNAPDKENCLILDFAGNIQRHGPIDLVTPKINTRNGGGAGKIVKTCPQCRSVLPIATRQCPDCGHLFAQQDPELNPTASTQPIISPNYPVLVKVDRITYSRHTKIGKPDSLRVDYYDSADTRYSEWLCFEHGGQAAQRAVQWWRQRSYEPPPLTITYSLLRVEAIRQPSEIRVIEQGKYWRILSYRFNDDEPPIVEVEDEMEYLEQEPVAKEELPF